MKSSVIQCQLLVADCGGLSVYYLWASSPFAASLLFPCGLLGAHAKLQQSFPNSAEGFDPLNHVIPAMLSFRFP